MSPARGVFGRVRALPLVESSDGLAIKFSIAFGVKEADLRRGERVEFRWASETDCVLVGFRLQGPPDCEVERVQIGPRLVTEFDSPVGLAQCNTMQLHEPWRALEYLLVRMRAC